VGILTVRYIERRRRKEMEFSPKVCDECKKLCVPLSTSSGTSDEWYCRNCHKSYSMKREVAEYVLERGKK
jgi:hypothetical protein